MVEKKEECSSREGRRRLRRRKGGIPTIPFIFGNEVAEKVAVVGFSSNMISYLTEHLHLPLTKAATTITNFNGTASLTPLIGAFIADSFVGRFLTITFASLLYQSGMICLTVSAVVPIFRPPPCAATGGVCREASGGQLSVLYISLLLTALGSGGIRPCVVAFGADQFAAHDDPAHTNRTSKFFNWYYFSMGVSMMVAVTVVVYIQDNMGWGWGLGIPTALMFISIVTFLLGYKLYLHQNPAGSPFTRLLQVMVAAFRKRRHPAVSNQKLLYLNQDLDAPISIDGTLIHTPQLKFLDKAAMVTTEDDMSPSGSPNLWRLNTVHRVEELKTVIRMGPIWASGILLITAYAQQNTFSLQQAKTMNRHLGPSFQIPAASMTVFTMISMTITIAIYDRLLTRIIRHFTGLDRGITALQRMGVGFFISILATLVAGFAEIKRKREAAGERVVSVMWLVPQYSLHGVAEAFMLVGHLEFLYDQSPESMKSMAAAFFWMAISAGNYMSTLMVSIVHRYTHWLPDSDLNNGKLEYFYWLLTFLQILNMAYFLICASFYTLKPLLLERKDRGEKAQVELAASGRV